MTIKSIFMSLIFAMTEFALEPSISSRNGVMRTIFMEDTFWVLQGEGEGVERAEH